MLFHIMHSSYFFLFIVISIAIANPIYEVDDISSSSDTQNIASNSEHIVDTSSLDAVENTGDLARPDILVAINDEPAGLPGNSVNADSLYASKDTAVSSTDNSAGSAVAVCDNQHRLDSSLLPETSLNQNWGNIPIVLKKRQTLINGINGIMQFVNPGKPSTAPNELSTDPADTSCESTLLQPKDPKASENPSRRYRPPGYPQWALDCENNEDFPYSLCCSGHSQKLAKRRIPNDRPGRYRVGGCLWC